ncbi:MAG: hypothetical protein AAGJ38_01355 [Planctomycetota bacterium]
MRIAAAFIVAVLPALPTLAQEVSQAREGNAWISYVVAAVLALFVGVVSFMGAKRSHEDT